MEWSLAQAVLLLVVFSGGIAVGAYLLWEAQRRGLFTSRQEADPFMGLVNALVDERLDRAEAFLVRRARADRNNVRVNRALAAVYRRQGQWAKALKRDRSIAVQEGIRPPVKAEAFYHLALDYQGLGRHKQCVEALEEAMRLAPRNRRIALTLVDELAGQEDWGRAYEIYSRRARPGSPYAAARLAHFQVELGQALLESDPKAARRHFARAIELHPAGYAARLLMGDAYAASDRYDKAIAAWSYLTETRPELFTALYPRFEDAFFQQGRFDKLGSFIQQQLPTDRDDPQALVILARYLAKKQMSDNAIRELRSALAMDSGLIEAHRELGRLLLDRGETAKALDSYADLLEQLPGRTPGFRCRKCSLASDDLFWRCPACGTFESATPARSQRAEAHPEAVAQARLAERMADLLPDTKPVRVGKVPTG